jgi:hypothetical protein
MDDIEYFRTQIFAAMKVPKSYLGQDEGTARAVLSAEDVRFARTVLRVQRELKNGLRKISRVHLSALNIDPQQVSYDVHMTVPSAVFELAQMEVRNARADLANRMREFVSMQWILSKVFDMSDEDIKLVMVQRDEDLSRDQISQAKAQIASNAVMSGMPGGDQGAPGGDAGAGGGAAGGDQGKPEATAREITKALASNKIDISPDTRSIRTRAITERELLRGDRDAEKRAEDKLEKLLKSDERLARRMGELKGMMADLRSVAGRRR